MTYFVWLDDRDGDLTDVWPDMVLTSDDFFPGGALFDQLDSGDNGWNVVEVGSN